MTGDGYCPKKRGPLDTAQCQSDGSVENVMHKKARRSLVAGALFVSLFFVEGGCYLTFGLFFMPLVKEFRATHASVSLLSTLILVVSGLTGPFAGWLLKRIGAKLVMGVGAADQPG
jgi:MFS family permease